MLQSLQQRWCYTLLLCILTIRQVHAYAGVIVLTVEHVDTWSDTFDETCLPLCFKGSPADFYAFVLLDGHEEQSDYIEDQDHISPTGGSQLW
jgi:hypothetical protein